MMSSSSSSSESEDEQVKKNRAKSTSSFSSSEDLHNNNQNRRSRSSSGSSLSADEKDNSKDVTVLEVEDPPSVTWDAKEKLSLLEGILDQIKPRDMTPFDQFKINWKRVHTGKPIEECQKMWDELRAKARQYRTIREVAEELLLGTETTNSAVEKWNSKLVEEKSVKKIKRVLAKKAKASGGSFPARAPTAYELYKKDMFKQMREGGVPSNMWFKNISETWNKMDPEKKKEYDDLSNQARLDNIQKLSEISSTNPDDDSVTKMLASEKKKVELYRKNTNHIDVRDNHKIDEYMNKTPISSLKKKLKFSSDSEQDKPVMAARSHKKKLPTASDQKDGTKQAVPKKRAASNSDMDSDSSSETEEPPKQNGPEISVSLSDSEEEIKMPPVSPKKKKKMQVKSDQEDSSSPKKQKKKAKLETIGENEQLESSPSKKKKVKLEENPETSPSVQSPKKKKKKAVHVWTGMEIFLDLKKDVYKMSHTDLSEDKLLAKMRSKYEKMPENKQRKYQHLADQRNINS